MGICLWTFMDVFDEVGTVMFLRMRCLRRLLFCRRL